MPRPLFHSAKPHIGQLLLLLSLATVAPSWSQSYALALHLPKDAVSLCVLKDRSAWGFDFGLKTDKDHSITSVSIDRRFVRIGATYQRTLWDTEGNVEPLWFLRISGSLDAIQPGRDLQVPGDPAQVREWESVITVGPAVSWKPYKNVSLWVRQGISFARWMTESDHWPRHRNGVWYSLRTSSPMAMAVFMW